MKHTMITIHAPCHENWSEMTPVAQGRHCQLCSKTVIDFTEKEPEEILQYFKMQQAGKVCGRFLAPQLNTPIPSVNEMGDHILCSALSILQKVAAMIVVVFAIGSSGCNTDQVMGKVGHAGNAIYAPLQTITQALGTPLVVGTLSPDTILPPVTVKTPICRPAPGYITGEPTMIDLPDSTVLKRDSL